MTLLCLTPFSNICENFLSTSTSRTFWRKIRHCFKRNNMADVQDFLSAFGEFLRFYVISGYIFNRNHWENARLTIIHVYLSTLSLAVSLGSNLNPRPAGGLGFRQLPRATANVFPYPIPFRALPNQNTFD